MTADKNKTELEEDKTGNVTEDMSVVDGELLEVSEDESIELFEEETKVSSKIKDEIGFTKTKDKKSITNSPTYNAHYLFLPFIFLTVSLLGGMRIGIKNNEFIFLRPALICLVFSAVLLVLFFRAKLIKLDKWFNENFSTLKNIANGAVLFSLFAASTQVFNSLIPEQGLPFWIIAFCFFWTLWNNIFAEFDTKRLLQSLGGLFGLAFVIKYLIFANLVSAEKGSWLYRVWESPTQEAATYFLGLPSFAAATGYIQFFALVFYLIGLFLLRADAADVSNQD